MNIYMYECFVVKAVFVYSNVSVFSVMWLELLIMLEISQCNDQCMSTHTLATSSYGLAQFPHVI